MKTRKRSSNTRPQMVSKGIRFNAAALAEIEAIAKRRAVPFGAVAREVIAAGLPIVRKAA